MKKRLVDADKLMERAKMNSVMVTVEHDHHDYGLTLGTLDRLVKECEITGGPADLVSKKSAIDAAIEAVDEWDGGYNVDRANKIIRAMMRLPSEAPDGPDNLVKDSQCLVKDLVNDCISRRAAVDVINESNSPIAEYLIGEIMALPSAQEKRTDKRTEMHTCDLISRQAAIDALAKFVPYAICDESTESYTNGLTDAYNLILKLPSAQPERKRGKWIEDDDGWDGVIWRCSECDAVFTLVDGTPEENEYYFCPNCGADMREVDE